MADKKKEKEARRKKALAIQTLQKHAAKLGCRVTAHSGVTMDTLDAAIELLQEAVESKPDGVNASLSMSEDASIKLSIRME